MKSALTRVVAYTTVACLATMMGVVVAAPQASDEPRNLRLRQALERQDRSAVNALVVDGVDVGVARADGVTALHLAAHWDDVELAERLLAAGADPTAVEDHGVTPLGLACENASVVSTN